MYKYFEGGKKKKPGMGALIGREINTEERRNNVCAHMHNNDQTNREREFKSERIRKKGKWQSFKIQWKKVTFSMHLRSVLTFLTHQPIPMALNSDHWGSPLWIAGIILISSSSASEWKAQAKWQVDTPKLETWNNSLVNYINNNILLI